MPLRCPECRSRRATFTSLLKHISESGHKLCHCSGIGGYHYAHRPGSPQCERNPYHLLHRARRSGEELTQEEWLDLHADGAFRPRINSRTPRGDPGEPPF